MDYLIIRDVGSVGIDLTVFPAGPFAGRASFGLKNDVQLQTFLYLSYNRFVKCIFVPVDKSNI
jgi:hypothetical protein